LFIKKTFEITKITPHKKTSAKVSQILDARAIIPAIAGGITKLKVNAIITSSLSLP